jgi:hypothetical protein
MWRAGLCGRKLPRSQVGARGTCLFRVSPQVRLPRGCSALEEGALSARICPHTRAWQFFPIERDRPDAAEQTSASCQARSTEHEPGSMEHGASLAATTNQARRWRRMSRAPSSAPSDSIRSRLALQPVADSPDVRQEPPLWSVEWQVCICGWGHHRRNSQPWKAWL